jgi:hypothetical protein
MHPLPAAFNILQQMKKILFTVLLFAAIQAGAQQVNGHWYGIGMLSNTKAYNSYLSEMTLRQKGNTVWGELAYYFKDSLVKVPLNGIFDNATRRLNIQPFPMIYYLSPNARNSIDCYLSGNFSLVASKAESVLSGSLGPDDDHKYTVPAINYRFVRSDDTLDLVMPPDVEEPTVAVPVKDTTDEYRKRAKVYTKEIEVVNNSLRLEIYDNGEIDRDSISLYQNDRLILPKSMLTHRAIRVTFQLDPAREFDELSMFAENLGMIPPNTAALVIYDGTIRYEIVLSSDLSKSATIKIKRKK